MKRPRPTKIDLAQKHQTRGAKRTAARVAESPLTRTFVNPDLLAPNPGFGLPDFMKRGYYEDRPFSCKDCGKAEVWTATQQKWWYETAKGGVWTTAIRCRQCRRAQDAERAEQQVRSTAGAARKRARAA